jgi:predicted acylesterase/phospholipase RssA
MAHVEGRGPGLDKFTKHPVWAALRSWTAARLLGRTRYVALGGGSLLACMYIGVLQELTGHDDAVFAAWANQLKGVAGTSAGAILGFLIAAGTTTSAMCAMMAGCNVTAIAEEAKGITGSSFAAWGAITSGAAIDDLLLDIVQRALALPSRRAARELTLADFQGGGGGPGDPGDPGGRPSSRPLLTIVVTNADEGVVEYWSAATRPTVPLWLALRASVAVPGLFPEVVYEGVRYQDGGITCNLPCFLFPALETLSLFVHVGGCASGDETPASRTASRTASRASSRTSSRASSPAKSPAPVPPSDSAGLNLASMLLTGSMRALKMVQLYLCAAQLGPLRGNPLLVCNAVPCRALTSLGLGGAFAFHGGATAMQALAADGVHNARSIILRDALALLVFAGAFGTAVPTPAPAAATPSVPTPAPAPAPSVHQAPRGGPSSPAIPAGIVAVPAGIIPAAQ